MDSYGGGYGGNYGGVGYDDSSAATGYGGVAGSGGYGGYGANAPTGDAGGFVSPQSNGQSSQGASRTREEQTARTVTINQIQSATKTDANDKFQLDGHDLHQVVFTGCVVAKEERATHAMYTIEDGSGKVSVKKWNNRDDDGGDAAQADKPDAVGAWTIREGDYVLCTAGLKDFDSKKQMSAFSIRPIRKDFNEVMHYQFQAIYEHLYFTKCPLPDPRGGGIGNSTALEKAPQFAGRGPAVTAGTDQVTDRILKVIRSCDDQTGEGVSMQQIVNELQRLGADWSRIRNVIADMCDDGLLYSTVDDDHFATTTAE